jgi:hypothetical protein
VSRRVSLPGADALFGERRADDADTGPQPGNGAPDAPAESSAVPPAAAQPSTAPFPADLRPLDLPSDPPEPAGSSKRVRHDEKITVYMSADELVGLEHARLVLRRDFGLAVDRGRIVRESLSLALNELEVGGADSPLVSRLHGTS